MRTLLLLAALGTALAGCGGAAAPAQAPSPTSTAAATPSATVSVSMRHNRFGPHTVVVRLGQTVRWTNHDAVAHTVASSQLRLASEAIPGSATFTYRPRRRGRFAYFCTIHAGQTGVLVVR
jgi:plastocyanin